jgi:hypothetical protein
MHLSIVSVHNCRLLVWSWLLSWSRRFEDPIELPDGRKLKTLAEAMAWLAKEVPKSELA